MTFPNLNFTGRNQSMTNFNQPGYLAGLNPQFQNPSPVNLDFFNQTGSFPDNLGIGSSYGSIGSIGSGTSNYASRQGFPGATAYGNTPSTGFKGFGADFFDKGNTDLGFNVNTAGLAFGGLSALTNLYTGLQGLKLAKEQFNFGKESALRNERNAVRDYNSALEDRLKNRDIHNRTDVAQTELERRKAIAG